MPGAVPSERLGPSVVDTEARLNYVSSALSLAYATSTDADSRAFKCTYSVRSQVPKPARPDEALWACWTEAPVSLCTMLHHMVCRGGAEWAPGFGASVASPSPSGDGEWSSVRFGEHDDVAIPWHRHRYMGH